MLTMSQVEITTHPTRSGQFLLQTEIVLPESRDRVFEFFADAFRLETITPPWLHFEIIAEAPISMQEGQRIDYKLRLHGIPIRWQSEISVWEPPFRFVDQQIKGPYKRWHHEHLFEEHPNGTLVRDRVEYAVPGGWLINRFFVQRDLRKIFQFRHRTLVSLFTMDALNS
ncbi:MAG: SRPBCC family protein [Planctomycetaceae bacterium]|nr:SRPBCC family protein [Planctomycetaceae bacterium]